MQKTTRPNLSNGIVTGTRVGNKEPATVETWLTKKWTYTTDVLVIGTGLAGLSAAITAHDAGADVLILEKMAREFEGGNSKVSGNGFWAPLDLDKGIEYIKAMDFGQVDDEDIFRIMAEGLVENLKIIEKLGGKYGLTPPGWGKAPTSWGLSFPALKGSESLRIYEVLTPEGKTGEGEGKLWKLYRDNVESRKIKVLYETPAKELIQDANTKEILGVIADSNGKIIKIKAKKAVILACGGFEFNFELQKQYFPARPIYGTGTPGNTGDGILMAQKVGADLWHMNEANGGGPGVMVLPGLPELPILSRPLSFGYIWVDKRGKRYVNETAEVSHGRGVLEYTLMFDAVECDFTRIPTWFIFDDNLRQKGALSRAKGPKGIRGWFGWHSKYVWSEDNSVEIKNGWIVKGDSIEELANKIKADPDNLEKMDAKTLEENISRYNNYCKQGKDSEFGRPIETMSPLKAPFYAVKLWPSTANTMGGPRRNKYCQIVDPDRNPIPRLYGTGECGSFWGWMYNSGGNIGECMFTGRIAVKHATALNPWD